MQSKMIAAAAIASSASAMRLTKETTNLAQAQLYDCHGTYAYQCLEDRVNDSLGRMTAEVQDHKNDVLVNADELREDIWRGVFDLRDTLEDELDAAREENFSNDVDKQRSTMDVINGATEAAKESLCTEAEERVSGDSPASVERLRVQGEIKKIFYEDRSADPAAQKAEIKALVDGFNTTANIEGANYDEFAAIEIASLEQVITTEYTCFTDQIDEQMTAWNTKASEATAKVNAEIMYKLAHLDSIIEAKTEEMNDIVAHLTEDFLLVFWKTIEEVYAEVSYYERSGLIWKALYQKDQFLAAIESIRTAQAEGLAETRATLVAETNAERTVLAAFINEQRTTHTEANTTFKTETKVSINTVRTSVDGTVEEKLQFLNENGSAGEEDKLLDYVYELTTDSYKPTGYGHDGNGYQPYGKWVSNNIADQTSVYGVDDFATFSTVTQGAMDTLNAVLAGEQSGLGSEKTSAVQLMDTVTAGLIDNLVSTRENMEAVLTEMQAAQEEGDTEARYVDQAALVSTKNGLWRDLSWIVRQTIATAGGHEHGLSAGPVYGYLNQFAQTGDYKEPYGFGAEGADDGYDPYGYGDQGYGYGYAQTQYKQIGEKLAAMKDAQALIFQQNEDRLAASRAALYATHTQAEVDFNAALATKWASLTAHIETQNAAYAAVIESRNGAMSEAADAARQTILTAKVALLDALDAREKEIRWAITSIYNYDHQHALNEGLTAARDAMNAACDARVEDLASQITDIESAWSSTVASESTALDSNTEEEVVRCEDAKQEQGDIFYAFKDAQVAQFEQFVADETAALQEFVDECQDAWETILTSYCLHYGHDDEVVGSGRGCSYGNGSGIGNAGYIQGVAVEEHQDVLSYGQDLDIKHINNLDDLIAHAVDYTMEGVAEEAAAQAANVDAAQADIEAAIDAARNELMYALNARLVDSVNQLDAAVASLGQDLLDSENENVGATGAAAAVWEQEISDLREHMQWAIKELVFRLGYTQGYHYGGNDGEDHEIMEMIKEKKDEFDAFLVGKLQQMQDLIVAEQASGDERYAAASASLDAIKARISSEMDAAITAAIASFEVSVQAGRDEMNAAIQAATDALYAFIDGRLAVWGEKAHYEEKNAKGQEDSYYRYNLLRLLQHKQAAVDQAVADAKAAWTAAMTQEKAEAQTFRGDSRTGFADFTAVTSQALTDAIMQDMADMDAILEEREASLDAKLAGEQGSFEEAVMAERDQFKRDLKEIYNYNTYDIELTKTQETIAAPYSHEQHVAFIHKFTYYLKDSYSKFDSRISGMYNAAGARVTDRKEQSKDQMDAMLLVMSDLNEDCKKQTSRVADALIEQYSELQDAETELLMDARAAFEAAATAGKDEAQLAVIYNMHVLQYAGGKDNGPFGFGAAASSYYGKGNKLTGVDELDLFRVDGANEYGYAQVSSGPDAHHDNLEQALEDAKLSFDDTIAAAVADFGAHADAEVEEAGQTLADYTNELTNLVAFHALVIEQLGERSEATLAEDNASRQAAFDTWAQEQLDAFCADIDSQTDKVNTWFGDRLAWVANLYDSAYKQTLVGQLEDKRDHALAGLAERKETAQSDMDSWSEYLEYKNGDDVEQLADFNAGELSDFVETSDDLLDNFADEMDSVFDEFTYQAGEQISAMEDFAQATTGDWAAWLEYIYGYTGYEGAFPQGYEQRSYGPGGKDGAFSGYTGGAGYGGDDDYLFGGEHVGLAHGTEIGPNRDYFPATLFDEPEAHGMDYEHDAYTGLSY